MDFSASYGSLKEAEAGLKAQAHALGFDLAVKERFPRGAAAEEVTRVNYRCAKGRSHAPKNDEVIHTTKGRKTSSQMTACGYKINLKLTDWRAGTRPSQIMANLREAGDAVEFSYQDLANLLHACRREELNGRTPIQWLYEALRKSFSIAAVFINAEKEEQYTWALQALREFLTEEDLPLPKLIVTDRELALINALKRHEAFTLVPRLLCRWHVNMNVLAKELLVDAWVNKILHFGNRTTSIVESLHAGMKRFISSAGGDLATVFRKLKAYWRNQAADIALARNQAMNKVPFGLSDLLYGDVKSAVVPHALRACEKEVAAIEKQPRAGRWDLGPPEPCTCSITTSHGLPCRHALFLCLRNSEPLSIAQFDPYWRWDRTAIPSLSASPSRAQRPLDPAVVRGKGRPRGLVATDKSTKRLPSAHEITEAEERREALPPPSTAPARLNKPAVPADDPYEAGTAMPRRSGQWMARLESVDDQEAEFDLIPTNFEGKFDEKVAEAEATARQATQDAQESTAF
ncbi:hypothetical protein CHGG_00358 [Chaetomium globosum CBS 148.51]|uniref:SWIM-type domain-containing protein n=1 Tax=Chaetomium globosum (strain ATCC 6205 / CBS 148.51 / DSM 1962 / NBRC 6347 / NRRL 1970) TaxID=306901 RepID=Q2HHE6_CHAGB|nr:uncharacterized protein CHGG_00358 [Chaetomium globosum CBS 148.51]EAQ92123.1 hypothetical protein CHGG_00358 [Chaetomium globosum CBS 148.51]